jgi:hypothetical protein
MTDTREFCRCSCNQSQPRQVSRRKVPWWSSPAQGGIDVGRKLESTRPIGLTGRGLRAVSLPAKTRSSAPGPRNSCSIFFFAVNIGN